jgi:YD repeat-containing protein
MYSSDEEGKISGVIGFSYNDKNQLILVSSNYPTKYEYDERGRRIKTEWYNVNKELIYYIESSYEGENKLPSRKFLYDNNRNVVESVKFDKWGNLVENSTVDGCLIFKKRYEGELLLERIISQDVLVNLNGGCSDDFASITKYTYANIKTNMFKSQIIFRSIFSGILLDEYDENFINY